MRYIPFPRPSLDNDSDLQTFLRSRAAEKDWAKLKPYFEKHLALSSLPENLQRFEATEVNSRCWYSEMLQIGGGELHIDHFRPKGNVESICGGTGTKIMEMKTRLQSSKGIDITQHEAAVASAIKYDWLINEHRNYRPATASTNDGSAKHDFFPVAIGTNRYSSPQLPWGLNGFSEYPLLLDPANPNDDGSNFFFVHPAGELRPIEPSRPPFCPTPADYANIASTWNNERFRYLRACISIEVYQLNRPDFIIFRNGHYKTVTSILEKLELTIQAANATIQESTFIELVKYLLPYSQYSLTAYWAIEEYTSIIIGEPAMQRLKRRIYAYATSLLTHYT